MGGAAAAEEEDEEEGGNGEKSCCYWSLYFLRESARPLVTVSEVNIRDTPAIPAFPAPLPGVEGTKVRPEVNEGILLSFPGD